MANFCVFIFDVRFCILKRFHQRSTVINYPRIFSMHLRHLPLWIPISFLQKVCKMAVPIRCYRGKSGRTQQQKNNYLHGEILNPTAQLSKNGHVLKMYPTKHESPRQKLLWKFIECHVIQESLTSQRLSSVPFQKYKKYALESLSILRNLIRKPWWVSHCNGNKFIQTPAKLCYLPSCLSFSFIHTRIFTLGNFLMQSKLFLFMWACESTWLCQLKRKLTNFHWRLVGRY